MPSGPADPASQGEWTSEVVVVKSSFIEVVAVNCSEDGGPCMHMICRVTYVCYW